MTNLVMSYLVEVIISAIEEKRDVLGGKAEGGRGYILLLSSWS